MKKIKFILAILGLFFASCIPNYSGPDNAKGIVVVGDSLTNEAGNELDFFYSLDPAVKAAVHGVDGLTSCFATHDIQEVVDTMDPAVLVIALGTNDYAGGWTVDDFLCITDIVLNITPGVDVLWIVPPIGSQQVRDSLEYWDAPHVQIAGWDEVTLYPAYYRADGVHHNSKGRVAYAEFIVQSTMLLV